MPENDGVTGVKLTNATNEVTTSTKSGLLYGYVLKGGTVAGSSVAFLNCFGGTNLVRETKFSGAEWSASDGATITITQGQTDPLGGSTATRIQSTGGTTVYKYYNQLAVPSATGSKYATSLWIKMNTGTVIIDDRLGSTRTVTETDFIKVLLVSAGDGATNYQIMLKTALFGDTFDCVVWQPRAEVPSTLWEDYIILQAVAGDAGKRLDFDVPIVFSNAITATIGNTANGATACVSYKEIE